MGKEKKEIWMEKLIELLNEFLKKEDKSTYTFYWNQVFNCIHRWNWERCDKEWICSKSFWFIKWLVENDKIDIEEVEKINQTWNVYIRFWWDYEKVLMILAIQDEPINFLISILK